MKTISQIVGHLIQAHREGKSIDLSSLKTRYSRENGLSAIPKTMDIIAAIPDQFKKHILPKIKGKAISVLGPVSSLSLIRNSQACPHSIRCSY